MKLSEALTMTRAECIAAGLAEMRALALGWIPATLDEKQVQHSYAELHRQSVKDALRDGLPVRWDVLAEYPDLQEAVT